VAPGFFSSASEEYTARTKKFQETKVVTTYSDFRKTGYGVTGPFYAKINYGRFQLTTAVSKIEFNIPVDLSVFEMKK
jgi:hypothetical protein